MKLLIYSELNERTLKQNLGRADYSYFLVARIFAPMLQRFGDVEFIDDPAQADTVFDAARSNGEDCLLLCFTPPHRAPVSLRCPAVTVFAWEYADLPAETWDDDARNDWRYVLRRHGRAICHSTYSAEVVRKALGEDFPVFAIPAPVFEKFAAHVKTATDASVLFAPRTLRLRGNVVDSRQYRFIGDSAQFEPATGQLALAPWDRQPVTLNFAHREPGSGLLDGFYLSEPWGTWSRSSQPTIFLPFLLQGCCRLRLVLAGHGSNVGREVWLEAGSQRLGFRPTDSFTAHEFVIDATQPVDRLRICGLDTHADGWRADPRSLGIGVCTLQIEPADTAASGEVRGMTDIAERATTVTLHGIVYTSVLNPDDGRKNWQDIVTAFCHALRDADDATLVIKAVHHSMSSYLGTLNYLLHCIGPMRCRVVLLHGYLDDDDYGKLIAASTYYVNASTGEGGCLPLVEFISTRTPAIAPDHTAMRDYIRPESSFVVKSAPVCTNWPQDPRLTLRTSYYRIDWQSLSDQFRASYALVKNDVAAWHAMGVRAAADAQRFYGSEHVHAALQRFLQARPMATDEAAH